MRSSVNSASPNDGDDRAPGAVALAGMPSRHFSGLDYPTESGGAAEAAAADGQQTPLPQEGLTEMSDPLLDCEEGGYYVLIIQQTCVYETAAMQYYSNEPEAYLSMDYLERNCTLDMYDMGPPKPPVPVPRNTQCNMHGGPGPTRHRRIITPPTR